MKYTKVARDGRLFFSEHMQRPVLFRILATTDESTSSLETDDDIEPQRPVLDIEHVE